jgi:hypothetical protein
MNRVVEVEFERFRKNPIPVLEEIRNSPKLADDSVVWETILGPTGGSYDPRGGRFVMAWTELDGSTQAEMKQALRGAIAQIDVRTANEFSAEINRLRQLAG